MNSRLSGFLAIVAIYAVGLGAGAAAPDGLRAAVTDATFGAASVTGLVILEGGEPAQNVDVTLNGRGGCGVDGVDRASTTDADGRYRFDDVPTYSEPCQGAGLTYSVAVGPTSDERYALVEQSWFHAHADEVRVIDFTLPLAGIVSGDVTSSGDGLPVQGARVKISAGAVSREVTSDDQGAFRFTGIAPGRIFVSVIDDDFYSAPTQRIELESGQLADAVHFILDQKPVVSGTITDGGDPTRVLPGILVSIPPSTGDGREPNVVETDADGHYSLVVDDPGRMVIVATDPDAGFNKFIQVIDVDDVLRLDLKLTPSV